MEYRPLEITLVSATDLKDVNLFTRMDVYALVSISGDPRTMQRTPVHEKGGKNPIWNYTMKFTVDENLANQNRLNLVIQLRSRRSLGDREIGQAYVPIKELLDNPGDGKNVVYKVRKPSGKGRGELSFSFKFGNKVTQEMPKSAAADPDEPVTAYPAYTPSGPPYQPPAGYAPPPVAGYGGYAPPPVAGYGGYAPPPVAGYGGYPQAGYGGYPPPPPPQGGHGYGYGGYPQPMQQQAPPRRNKLGMGLGAGLLGGALGGMLIGDMVSDSAGYDAGYDAGFDDGGGFDF